MILSLPLLPPILLLSPLPRPPPRHPLRAKLLAIKGVGPWTVDMFSIFTLHRSDVLPTGDLGVRKGMQVCVGVK